MVTKAAKSQRVSDDPLVDSVLIAGRREKVTTWAATYDKRLVSILLANLFFCTHASKKARLEQGEFAREMEGFSEEALHRLVALWRELMAAKFLLAEQRASRIKGAKIKLIRDPKQTAKAAALILWIDWQTGKTLHKGAAAFARYVCIQYPVIENPTTVERWARTWAADKTKK